MTDGSLPEDVRLWPNDAYQLLGLPYSAGRDEIRKAYVVLLRRYRPEQFPEAFRRVREAYETAMAQVEIEQPILPRSRPVETPPPSAEVATRPESPAFSAPESEPVRSEELALQGEPPASEPVVDTAKKSSFDDDESFVLDVSDLPPDVPVLRSAVVTPTPSAKTSGSVTDDDLHRLWQLAIDGQTSEALAGLKTLLFENPYHPDLTIRIYWLLTLQPELAPEESPFRLLMAAAIHTPSNDSLVRLLLEELSERPEELLSERIGQLLCDSVWECHWTILQRMRWKAAGDRQQWSVIETDLQRLMATHPHHRWAHLQAHLTALGRLFCDRGDSHRELAERLMNFLNQNQEWNRDTEYLLQQAEQLDGLLRERFIQQARRTANLGDLSQPPIPWEILHWVRDPETEDAFVLRQRFNRLLMNWDRDPLDALAQVDDLWGKFPFHAMKLYQVLLNRLYAPLVEADLTDEEVSLLLEHEFLIKPRQQILWNELGYTAFRMAILKFCVEQFVNVEQAITLIFLRFPEIPHNWQIHHDDLQSDYALKSVVIGCQIFWA